MKKILWAISTMADFWTLGSTWAPEPPCAPFHLSHWTPPYSLSAWQPDGTGCPHVTSSYRMQGDRTHLGLAPPTHLLHCAASVPLLSGPIWAGSSSTAACCQHSIANTLHVPRHLLVVNICHSKQSNSQQRGNFVQQAFIIQDMFYFYSQTILNVYRLNVLFCHYCHIT